MVLFWTVRWKLLAEVLHSTIVALVPGSEFGGGVDSGQRLIDVSLLTNRTAPWIIQLQRHKQRNIFYIITMGN